MIKLIVVILTALILAGCGDDCVRPVEPVELNCRDSIDHYIVVGAKWRKRTGCLLQWFKDNGIPTDGSTLDSAVYIETAPSCYGNI